MCFAREPARAPLGVARSAPPVARSEIDDGGTAAARPCRRHRSRGAHAARFCPADRRRANSTRSRSTTASCPSHSEVALALLTLAMVVLYATSGILDFFRARLLGEAALRLDRALSARVFADHLNPGCADDAVSARPRPDARIPVRPGTGRGVRRAVASRLSRRNLPAASVAWCLRHGGRGPHARAYARGGAARGRGAHADRTARGRWSFASSSRGAAAVAPMALESGLHQRWTTLNRRHLQAQSLAARHASALERGRQSGAAGAAIWDPRDRSLSRHRRQNGRRGDICGVDHPLTRARTVGDGGCALAQPRLGAPSAMPG